MFECRIRKDVFPKEGDVVIGKISNISNEIVTMELLEYGNIPGLILSSELSKKRFKTIAQITKVGNIEICQVLKVEESKGFVDLSLKRVSDKEKAECRELFSKTKLAYQIIAKACKISGLSIKETYENWGYAKESEYGTLFSYFVAAKNDLSILDSEPNGECFKKVIEDQFKASTFKVRIDVEVTCNTKGVIGIKEAFNKALEYNSDLEISLLKSPVYSIVKIGDDKEESFNIINKASEIVKASIESMGGSFSVTSPPKIYGEKSRHTLLDENKQNLNDSDEDTESD